MPDAATSRARESAPTPHLAPVADSDELSDAESALIDDAVAHINEAVNRSGLDLAADVYSFIIGRFFGGSYEAFVEPSRLKARSFAALCQRDDLNLSQASLYALVRVGHQLEQLPATVARALTVKHHRALLPIADPAEKLTIAQRAADERWTAAEIDAAARRSRGPTTGGRPRLPSVIKQFRAFKRALSAAVPDEPLPSLSDAQRAELETTLGALEARIASVREALVSS